MEEKEKLVLALQNLVQELKRSPRVDQAEFFDTRLELISIGDPDAAMEYVRELRSCAAIAQYAGFSPYEETLLHNVIDRALKLNLSDAK